MSCLVRKNSFVSPNGNLMTIDIPIEAIEYRGNFAVSVIIPMHNAKKTIDTCLGSILQSIAYLEQTHTETIPIEVIIINDGSTDDSIQTIEAIQNKYPNCKDRLSIHTQAQQGPSAARNHGTRLAKNPWLLYIDTDVEIPVHCLARLQQLISTHTDIIGINALPNIHFDYGAWASTYTNHSLFFQLYHHGTMVNTCFTSLCLLHRNAWEYMHGWDESQYGRYVDDVQSRWSLPPRILQTKEISFIHHKHVHFWGLYKHRYNIGFHFIHSVWRHLGTKKTFSASKNSLHNIIIHARYPINCIIAFSSAVLFVLSFLPIQLLNFPICSGIILCVHVYTNFALAQFILEAEQTLHPHKILQTLLRTASIFFLAYIEGICMLLGMLWAIISLSTSFFHAPTKR